MLSAHANGLTEHLNKEKLIERIIKYERMVGTAIGGMDQSISVLGIKQACLYIQFNPIRSQIVELPPGYKFIIMNSLEESKKLETVGTRYNKRVCECKIAVRLLAFKLHIPKEVGMKWTILKEIQDYLGLGLESMSALIDQFIVRKPYSKDDLDKELGEPLETFLSDISASKIVIESNKEYRIW
jgi:galactokinase